MTARHPDYPIGTIVRLPRTQVPGPLWPLAVVLASTLSHVVLEDEQGVLWKWHTHFDNRPPRREIELQYPLIEDEKFGLLHQIWGPLPIHESAPCLQVDKRGTYHTYREFMQANPGRVYGSRVSHHVNDDVAKDLAQWVLVENKDIFDFPDLAEAGESAQLRESLAGKTPGVVRMVIGNKIRGIRSRKVLNSNHSFWTYQKYLKETLDKIREEWILLLSRKYGLSIDQLRRDLEVSDADSATLSARQGPEILLEVQGGVPEVAGEGERSGAGKGPYFRVGVGLRNEFQNLPHGSLRGTGQDG